MTCIRRHYHGAAVYLNPKIVGGKIPICGQTVPVINNNSWSNVDFLGFSLINDVMLTGGAVITRLTGFTTGDQLFGTWQDLDRDAWLLGSIKNIGVELVVFQEQPIIIANHGLPEDTNLYTNNIYYFSKSKFI
jgi:hypothetical protein